MVEQVEQKQQIVIREIICTETLGDMLTCLDDSGDRTLAYFYDPDMATHFIAVDTVATLMVTGEQRFYDIEQQVAELAGRVVCVDGCKPRLFGGFSFATREKRGKSGNHEGMPNEQLTLPVSAWTNWPDGMLILPKQLFCYDAKTGRTSVLIAEVTSSRNGATAVSVEQAAAQTESDAFVPAITMASVHDAHQDAHKDWLDLVQDGAKKIRDGELKKVVFARSSAADKTCSVSQAIEQLHQKYPDNFTYAIRQAGTCFLGSSPERLASMDGDVLKIDGLAGTERRGKTPLEDDELSAELMHSTKNRAEHQAVLTWVAEQIAPLVEQLDIAASPTLKKLTNLQHLYTPVRAGVKDGIRFFDVLNTLHPTPAVAGVPRAAALDYIRVREHLDRGWYAGPIGWVDLDGNGTFAVALRSGLVTGTNAVLFAGAGIMGDSVPETEWIETEMKLVPMRTALGCQSKGIS